MAENESPTKLTASNAEPDKMPENESLTKLISSNVEPIREDQVQNAVKFLSHPKVRGSPVIYRRSFLEKKGLTREEIDEAFRRVPDPPSGATVDNSLSSQANQQKPPSSSPLPVSAVGPTSVSAPTAVVSAATPVQPYKFQFSHALILIGVLAASGAGSAVVIKKAVLPRVKAWIRKVVKEDDTEVKEKPPSAVDEAVQAAKEAAAAAALIAKASQELLNSKNEEIKQFEAFRSVLDVQLEEMKLMRNSIYRLETVKESELSQDRQTRETSINGPTYIAPKSTGAYHSETRLPPAPKVTRNDVTTEYRAGNESESGFGRSSSAPANVEPTPAPYSKSYMDIMAMIQRGETPPGIKDINDMPPNPDQQLSNPRVAPRTKPWEYNSPDQQISDSSFPSSNEGYHEPKDNGHVSYVNGRAPTTSEYPWQKTPKISEVDTKQEERKAIPYGPGSGEWRGRSWVPPQPPSVAVPEAAIAIRQPKQSAQKQQPGKEISAVQYHLSEDGAGGTAGAANDTSSSSSQVADPPSISEIQEEPSSSIEV